MAVCHWGERGGELGERRLGGELHGLNSRVLCGALPSSLPRYNPGTNLLLGLGSLGVISRLGERLKERLLSFPFPLLAVILFLLGGGGVLLGEGAGDDEGLLDGVGALVHL